MAAQTVPWRIASDDASGDRLCCRYPILASVEAPVIPSTSDSVVPLLFTYLCSHLSHRYLLSLNYVFN